MLGVLRAFGVMAVSILFDDAVSLVVTIDRYIASCCLLRKTGPRNCIFVASSGVLSVSDGRSRRLHSHEHTVVESGTVSRFPRNQACCEQSLGSDIGDTEARITEKRVAKLIQVIFVGMSH